MTKKQKIWLSVTSAMFILPEILWSPVSNIIYELLQKTNNVQPYRINFLMNSDKIVYLSFVLFAQFVGCLLTLIFFLKHKHNNILFWTVILLLILLTFVTLFIFYMSITLGKNGIGF